METLAQEQRPRATISFVFSNRKGHQFSKSSQIERGTSLTVPQEVMQWVFYYLTYYSIR